MDFFDRQDAARRSTKLLVCYFILAIIATTFFADLAIYLVLKLASDILSADTSWIDWLQSPVSHALLFSISLSILLGSLYRYWSIRDDCGHSIATMAGATPLATNDWSPEEQVFMNVVEEMAIAAGIPVPSTYIMRNEASINAFVAGLKTSETALVITQGCLTNLNREELQGIVGHEFSHILNGDMVLNVRLFSLLGGILAVSQLGMFLMTAGPEVRVNRGRTSKGHGFQMQAFIIGLALYCVGYIGLICGRIIKAAISRQREYLADASSVQFTRQSDYIAAALYKMSTGRQHSYLHNTSHLEDVSHMCFGEVYQFGSTFISKWLATHPPVIDRINAVDRKYLIRMRSRKRKAALTNPNAHTQESALNLGVIEGSSYRMASGHASASSFSSSAGQITNATLDYANKLHNHIPGVLNSHVHTTAGAQALLFAFLINETQRPASLSQENHESSMIDMTPEQTHQTLRVCLAQIKQANIAIRLPLIDIALSQIKRLAQEEQTLFVKVTKQLILADKQYSLFEFTLFSLLKKALKPDSFKNAKIKYKDFDPIQQDIETIISAVLKASGDTWGKIEDRYHEVMNELGFMKATHFNELSEDPKALESALDKLNQLSPFMKRTIINTCQQCVTHDGSVTYREVELLRTICTLMDVPMPPVTPDQLTAA